VLSKTYKKISEEYSELELSHKTLRIKTSDEITRLQNLQHKHEK
jgi:hypothetical protein